MDIRLFTGSSKNISSVTSLLTSIMLLVAFLSNHLRIIQSARSKRCYVCRSRGPLGDCRDPFWWNATTVAKTHAIELSPCASGWCGKAIEGKDGDHLQATERICLQRPPSDGEERCSETFYENKRAPIFMCFCKGDLCNSAPKPMAMTTGAVGALILTPFLITIAYAFS